ncbi:LytR/AlgR family response regulator transcription factor [Undibacterium sp. TC4M20W]|uniref:LytR/AlgR family response regulator transcription factor n=1 Tax=Undibacterium sp. TC4M20W TaxID=3413052 RepID=UPI003BF1B71A
MPTALIADDEITLVNFLKAELAVLWPELKIIAEAYNGADALRLINELSPSIAFLDIRMPGMSGLELASQLQAAKVAPLMVFVTAYHQYAVDAFEREAVDYLLKPPTRERLGRCVEKLKRQLAAAEADGTAPAADVLARLMSAMTSMTATNPAATPGRLEWIRAAHGNDIRLISIDEVIYFEANDKYVSVFTATHESLIRMPLRELLDGLDASRFWQIHRGTIVAVKHIAGTTRDFRGRTLLKLKERPEELLVSRAYLHLFKQM